MPGEARLTVVVYSLDDSAWDDATCLTKGATTMRGAFVKRHWWQFWKKKYRLAWRDAG